MAVQITIRRVPKPVRDRLASRAALQGKSMQEYLRAELIRLSAQITPAELMERIRKRKQASPHEIPLHLILSYKDDRR